VVPEFKLLLVSRKIQFTILIFITIYVKEYK
jgi:hypothetical protein